MSEVVTTTVSSKVETIKCLLVGDDKVGKTSLLQTLATSRYPIDFIPKYHEKCSFYVNLDEIKDKLNLDSNGLVIELMDYEFDDVDNFNDKNDCLILNDFNIVLLCFSFDNKSSFESIKCKWLNMIENFNKNLSKNSDKFLTYVLVGLKSDFIDETTDFQRQSSIRKSKKTKISPNCDENVKNVQYDSYEKYAKKIGAADYIELSSKEIGSVDKNEEFNEKLNCFLEKIYKSYYFSNNDDNNKIKKLFKRDNNSYSRLQSPVILPTTNNNKEVEKSVKFKFMKLLRQCKKYMFSCTSNRYADVDEKYESLDRPTENLNKTNKLRNSKIKFPHRNINGKMIKLVNAESTTTLNIENDDVFY